LASSAAPSLDGGQLERLTPLLPSEFPTRLLRFSSVSELRRLTRPAVAKRAYLRHQSETLIARV
jgi:hypothetical protein